MSKLHGTSSKCNVSLCTIGTWPSQTGEGGKHQSYGRGIRKPVLSGSQDGQNCDWSEQWNANWRREEPVLKPRQPNPGCTKDWGSQVRQRAMQGKKGDVISSPSLGARRLGNFWNRQIWHFLFSYQFFCPLPRCPAASQCHKPHLGAPRPGPKVKEGGLSTNAGVSDGGTVKPAQRNCPPAFECLQSKQTSEQPEISGGTTQTDETDRPSTHAQRPTLPGNELHPTLPLGVALNCPLTQMSPPPCPHNGWPLLKPPPSGCAIASVQQGDEEANGWGAEKVSLFKPTWNLSPSVKTRYNRKRVFF